MIFKNLFDKILNGEKNNFLLYSKKFDVGFNVLLKALKNNTDVKHNADNFEKLFQLVIDDVKKYKHKNKISETEKQDYEILLKSITNYNKALNAYNAKRGVNEKTIGDCFRQIGAKTDKKSVETD